MLQRRRFFRCFLLTFLQYYWFNGSDREFRELTRKNYVTTISRYAFWHRQLNQDRVTGFRKDREAARRTQLNTLLQCTHERPSNALVLLSVRGITTFTNSPVGEECPTNPAYSLLRKLHSTKTKCFLTKVAVLQLQNLCS